jgi:hypothetical protein
MRVPSVAIVAAAAAFIVGALALPANADQYDCGAYTYSPSGQENFKICTWETITHNMYGTFEYNNSTSSTQTMSGTIVVQRCQVPGTNCTNITAEHLAMTLSSHSGSTYTTSSKPGEYGWIYHTCVSANSTSGWSFVWYCSNWNAYNP